MSTLLTDLLAVFGVVLNALPQGLWRFLLDLPQFRRPWHFLSERWEM